MRKQGGASLYWNPAIRERLRRDRYDAIVIGGGHNALVCAAYLARAGHRVTVLERMEQVGGMAATREFAPGYKASLAHLSWLLDADITRELQLAENGLEMAAGDLATVALAADGNHLVIGPDGAEGAGLADHEQAAFRAWRKRMGAFAQVIGSLHNEIPPRIRQTRADLLALGRLALRVRRMGRDDMREFLRIAGINIHDVLEEHFEHPLLKGALLHSGFALVDVISPCVTFNDHEGSTKSYAHTRKFYNHVVNVDYVHPSEEVKASYEAGEAMPIHLRGGDTIVLRKVDDGYDPTSRASAGDRPAGPPTRSGT